MFFPIRSDAPVYHFPWGTIGLIGINVLVWLLFSAGAFSVETIYDWWVLSHGTIDPRAWITSHFAHDGFFHLFFNMIFLWAFGLIVEGKLGWRVYVPLYLGIGLASSVLEQVLMLGNADSLGSLGASTIIFSLIVMSLFWAPRNEMEVAYWVFVAFGTFEVEVWVIAMFYIVWDLLGLVMVGGAMSTPFLHVMGAALGLVPAVLFLRKGWVDCEGWDLLTLRRMRGQRPGTVASVDKRRRRQEEAEEAERLRDRHAREMDREIAHLIHRERREEALGFYFHHKVAGEAWQPSREILEGLIGCALDTGRDEQLARLLDEVVARYPDDCDEARLRRIELLIRRDRRPSKAKQELAAIDRTRLPPELMHLHDRLAGEADDMIADGVVEIMD